MIENDSEAGRAASAGRKAGNKESDLLTNKLKQLYDPVLDEPLPDNILNLLAQLDSRQQ